MMDGTWSSAPESRSQSPMEGSPRLSLPTMEIPHSSKELDLFKKVALAADSLGYPCYLVGGFVRDKILERPTKDADFVCEGDGLELAKQAAKANINFTLHIVSPHR